MAPGGSASRSSCGSSGGPDSEPPSDPGGQLEAAGGCLYRLSARHRLEGGEIREHVVAMGRRADLYVDLPDDTGRVDQEGVPRGERLVPVRREGSVRLRDNRLGVGEQLEVQTFLRADALVRVHRVDADAEDDRVRLFVLREVALEVVGLHRAAGREVLRIEVEDDPL